MKPAILRSGPTGRCDFFRTLGILFIPFGQSSSYVTHKAYPHPRPALWHARLCRVPCPERSTRPCPVPASKTADISYSGEAWQESAYPTPVPTFPPDHAPGEPTGGPASEEKIIRTASVALECATYRLQWIASKRSLPPGEGIRG